MQMTSGDPIRLAILGCGAVTELGHLPAIAQVTDVRVTTLIDTNAARRERLAAAFGVEHTAADIDGCIDRFDAAVIALPHALHAPASIRLLQNRKAVLVEKPMALTSAECRAMIQSADATGAVLAVGLVRRFLRSVQFARTLITQGFLGKIESFDFREGNVYNWPVASDFFFRRDAAGGGVLVDTGAHTLDTLLYLLGDFADVAYFDDAEGGVDANCLLNVRLQDGTSGTVELSRTRRLRNSAIIRGARATLELAPNSNQVKLSLRDQPHILAGSVEERDATDQSQDYLRLLASQLQDFVVAIKTGRPPVADGRSATMSVRLMEACYNQRKPLDLPWENPVLGATA
jgi:predicted dehydrogenase